MDISKERNYETDRLVRDEIVEGAEWVAAGEGVATRKRDGTCCMIQGLKLFRRYDLKPGKTAPDGFMPAQEPDPVSGRQPGWVPVGDGSEDQYHRYAYARLLSTIDKANHAGVLDGTCELIGPKVQGNAENMPEHMLVRHGEDCGVLDDAPRTFAEIKQYLERNAIEGIVWHHPDGRMVKIKARDFGIQWPR